MKFRKLWLACALSIEGPTEVPLLRRVRRWRRKLALSKMRKLHKATRKLYAAPHPFTPLLKVNKLQRSLNTVLPQSLNWIVPKKLRNDAALRLQEIIYGHGFSSWVQSSIIQWEDDSYRAALVCPLRHLKAWNGPVDYIVSIRLFGALVVTSLLRGARRALVLFFAASNGYDPIADRHIIALNVPMGSVRDAGRGGVLAWLKSGSPFSEDQMRIHVTDTFLTKEERSPEFDWISVSAEAFPRIGGRGHRLAFYCHSVVLVVKALVLTLVGRWQAALLLSDLLEADYFCRTLPGSQLSGVATFIGDMPNRKLWICLAELEGLQTPLIYYASSYSLFSHKNEPVPDEIVMHELLANHWRENWYQTDMVAKSFEIALHEVPIAHGARIHKNIGAFDMVDGGLDLSKITDRSLAVFDIEPSAQPCRLSMHGYIVTVNNHEIILDFWAKLAQLADELDLTLVHKVKRRPSARLPSGYTRLLADIERRGRYHSLSADTGVARLLENTSASVALPFTSICDVASSLNRPSIYADFEGRIVEADKHSTPLL